MDVSRVKNDGDYINNVSKKNKKRKNGEIGELGGEELADEVPRKKMKMKNLGGMSDVVGCQGTEKRSRKEKKKKDKTQIDVIEQEGDNIREGDFVKDKSGDEREGKKEKSKEKSRIEVNAQEDNNKREGKIAKDKSENERERKKKKKDKSRIEVNAQEDDNKREGKVAKDNFGDERERKKKEMDKSRIDVNAQEDDNTMEGKIAKDKTGDEGERRKKKKDKGRIDVNAQEDDNETEGKFVKNNTGDERERKRKRKNESEKSKDAEFAGAYDRVGDADANQNDNGVTNFELVGGQKRKKKKDLKVLGAEEEILKDRFVNATSGGEDSENRFEKRKEKSVRSNMKGEVQADTLKIEKVNGSISHADSVESQMNNEDTEKMQSVKEKKKKRKKKDNQGVDSLIKEPMKKRKENAVGFDIDRGVTGILKDNGMNETAESSHPKKKSKIVKFSDNVEVFPHPDISSNKKNKKKKKKAVKDGDEAKESVKKSDDGLIRGKRFSKEEDEIIQNAVYKYIEDHQLGEEGLDMVLNCKSHPEIKNCWKEIGEVLPQRPYIAVYNRAHILFERSEDRKWTSDEIEFLMTYVKKHGPKWKPLSVELGKHRFHVKDAWRRNKFPNLKKGNWSVEEYEKLFELVNMDLRMKAYTEKKTKYGMLRDNICWEAISEELATRSNSLCCMRWYNQLTSPMVAEGQWYNADDYRLLIALNELDAACEEDVDWDNLLENRTGHICRKRWNQMVRHIGENGTKLFSEQVEILSRRYCPDLLDAREEYDNKPSVD